MSCCIEMYSFKTDVNSRLSSANKTLNLFIIFCPLYPFFFCAILIFNYTSLHFSMINCKFVKICFFFVTLFDNYISRCFAQTLIISVPTQRIVAFCRISYALFKLASASTPIFASSNIHSINTPYPTFGSCTKTCVTAPINFPFCTIGEPDIP